MGLRGPQRQQHLGDVRIVCQRRVRLANLFRAPAAQVVHPFDLLIRGGAEHRPGGARQEAVEHAKQRLGDHGSFESPPLAGARKADRQVLRNVNHGGGLCLGAVFR